MLNHKPVAIVFGGSGFLGSYVADALSEAHYEVRIFDQCNSPYLKLGQQMILGDLMDLSAVIKAAEGCDYVYNFAGIADIGDAKHRPIDTTRINVLGNSHTLEAAQLAKAKRFLFASTVYVFSESGSFYRASKQACERFIEAYWDQYQLPYTILRYGSLYGRRADERNGIYRLLKQAITDNVITYDGTKDTMREYIHVEDAARLSVKVLSEEYKNRHIILTGPERMSVHSLMKMIAEMVASKGEVKLEFSEKPMDAHYIMSPYAFNPKIGHKLISSDFVDIGQGLLDCLAEVHEQTQIRKQSESAHESVDFSFPHTH